MSIYTQTIQGIYTALASAVRNSTQTILGSSLIDPKSVNADSRVGGVGVNTEVSGVIAYLNVTAVPGIDTVQLVLEEQDPASGTWTQVCATLPQVATGMIKLKVKQAIAVAAATVSLVQSQDTMPAIWRLRVVHSGAGNFTYSLGVILYN